MSELTKGGLFERIGGFPLTAVRNCIELLWMSEFEELSIESTKHYSWFMLEML